MTVGEDIREIRELAARLRHLLQYEYVEWPSLRQTRTGRRLLEMGAPAISPLVDAYRELDPHPLPQELLAAMSAAPPGVGSPRDWPPFEGPVLGCAARSRATIRHWVRRLGFLANEEHLLSHTQVLKWANATQRLVAAPLPYLLEAAEDQVAGPVRDALLWLMSWEYSAQLKLGTGERPEGEVLNALRALLPRSSLHWRRVEPAVVERFAARGLVDPDIANIPRYAAAKRPLTAEEERSAELALLRLCADGRWDWPEVRATVAAQPRIVEEPERARDALSKRGLLVPFPLDEEREAWLTSQEGTVAGVLAGMYQWPFGPDELLRFSGALQGPPLERDAVLARLAEEPPRIAGALHEVLWCEGPQPPLVAAMLQAAHHPAPAVRAALLEGFASRLSPPVSAASQERPAGPNGTLLPESTWQELLRAGRSDPDAEVCAAASRLEAALKAEEPK